MGDDTYMTPKEAGFEVGVSARTVILWAEMGRIDNCFKLGGRWRISREGLTNYVEECIKSK